MYDIAGGAQTAINELSDAGKALTGMRSSMVFSSMPPGTLSPQQQSVPPPAIDIQGGTVQPGFDEGVASQSSFGQPSYAGFGGGVYDGGFGSRDGPASFGQPSYGGFGGGVARQSSFGQPSYGGFGGGGQPSYGGFGGGGFGNGW